MKNPRLSSRAALTPMQVRRIRQKWGSRSLTQSALAFIYDVSQATISNVVNRKVYKEVA